MVLIQLLAQWEYFVQELNSGYQESISYIFFLAYNVRILSQDSKVCWPSVLISVIRQYHGFSVGNRVELRLKGYYYTADYKNTTCSCSIALLATKKAAHTGDPLPCPVCTGPGVANSQQPSTITVTCVSVMTLGRAPQSCHSRLAASVRHHIQATVT